MRNQLFDAVKGIAIYLVVMGHLIVSDESLFQSFIEVCHMPVFFFVSGWFFIRSYEQYDVRTFLKKKILTVWIPYICWSFVSLVTNGITMLMKRDAAGLQTEMIDIFLHARSVWFLIVLFITNMVCLVVFRCAVRLPCSPYAVGVAVWVCTSVILQGGGVWRNISYLQIFVAVSVLFAGKLVQREETVSGTGFETKSCLGGLSMHGRVFDDFAVVLQWDCI